jgi:hypothetical protein
VGRWAISVHQGAMLLSLRDPAYTDRLAAFLRSLGQTAYVAEPGQVELEAEDSDVTRTEVGIYLRVWRVLCPEAEVDVSS